MSFFTNMIKELRDRKLWPIAIALIVALVAVPILLSKKAPTKLLVPQPTGGLPYSTGTSLPAISVKTAPGASKFAGKGRDPFTPQHAATTATVAAVTTTPTTPTASTPGTGTAGSGATTPSSGGGSTPVAPVTTSPTPAPTPTTPAPTPKPAPKPGPAGLTDKESYQVSLAMTTADGGVNTIDPLERLSILPSLKQPLLVELGVVRGGKQVLFAVEPGAAVGGPGTCTPGPIDCEIIALSPGQTEGVSKQTPTGTVPVALFSVNSITAAEHPTVAAANQARRDASDAGRQLMANTPLSAVFLFQYDPSVGAVVDLRNLTVGG